MASKTWYIEARVGSQNHRGDCVRFINDRRHTDESPCYDNRPAEEVLAEAWAERDALRAENARLREAAARLEMVNCRIAEGIRCAHPSSEVLRAVIRILDGTTPIPPDLEVNRG